MYVSVSVCVCVCVCLCVVVVLWIRFFPTWKMPNTISSLLWSPYALNTSATAPQKKRQFRGFIFERPYGVLAAFGSGVRGIKSATTHTTATKTTPKTTTTMAMTLNTKAYILCVRGNPSEK